MAHVYNHLGEFVGSYTTAYAVVLVAQHEDWTFSDI